MSQKKEPSIINHTALYTLTGPVVVHFLDGHTQEGELVKQDMFNLFLQVNSTPWLIPRAQVRYVAGQPDQPVEVDIVSQTETHVRSAWVGAGLYDTVDRSPARPRPAEPVPEAATQPLAEPEQVMAEPEAPAEVELFIPEPEPEPAPVFEPDVGLKTMLDAPLDFDAPAPAMPAAADLLDELAAAEESWDDRTMVLAHKAEEEDEITYVLQNEEEPAAPPRAICTTGPHAGEQYDLIGEVSTIGRSADNTIPLVLDKEVSRRHALIRRDHNQFFVHDQNSLNGVYVNNDRLSAPRLLQAGDVILIGITNIEFQG